MTVSAKDREHLLRRAMADLRAHINGDKQLRSFRVPTTPEVDVYAIRLRLNDSADEFAERIGLGVTRDQVIGWECGDFHPDADMCELLSLLDLFPEEVTRELQLIRVQPQ